MGTRVRRGHTFLILLLVIGPLVSTLAAVILAWQRYVFVSDLVLLLVLYLLTGLGVTIGYHRMLTHRSFEAQGWLRATLLILGSMAFEGSPLDWAATHVKHHSYSDDDDDPHSPLHGFWHAHMGWLFGAHNFADPAQYTPHLLRDRVVVMVSIYTPFFMVLSLVVPFIIGGWTGFLWGGAVRIFLLTHTTWSVNSVCHSLGRRPFPTLDRSHNNWLVGLLGFGEGWHNNHHAFPNSAFHGLRWWEFDLSGLLIRFFESMGWIWKVQRVPADVQQSYSQRVAAAQQSVEELKRRLLITLSQASQTIDQWWRTAQVDQRAQLRAYYEHARRRLGEIRDRVRQSPAIKQKTLLSYREEITRLLRTRLGRTQ